MYDNGVRLNRHAKKKMHKQELKRIYSRLNGCPDWQTLVLRNESKEPRKQSHPIQYWKRYSLSGARCFAKHCTNRKVRRITDNTDHEDCAILTHGQYKKKFDYDWTIW